jgi:hypothetical protein
MQGHSTKFRLVVAIGATAVAVLGVSSSSSAKPRPKPACQPKLVSLGMQQGLELYTSSVCGRRVGIPFG